MKKCLILFAIFLLSVACEAQRTTKYVAGIGSCVPVEGDDYKTYVKQIDIYDEYVYVTIARRPKRNLSRLNYWYSPQTRLSFGDSSIMLLGALSSDKESYHTCTYDDRWGWSNAELGKDYTFTLLFKGTIPDYVDYVDLIDDNDDYRGCSFKNLKLSSVVSSSDDTDDKSYGTYAEKSYHIAYTISNLNLREGPGTDYDIITKIPQYETVFYDDDDRDDDFTKVIYVATGDEGYVSSKYLDGFTPVKVNEDGLFQATGDAVSRYSDVVLYNDADVTANIKFGNAKYKVAPHTNKTISNVSKGKYNVVVSSPGTIPYVGVEKIIGGKTYTSHFYLHHKE